MGALRIQRFGRSIGRLRRPPESGVSIALAPACALVRRGDGDGPERGAAGEGTGTDQQLTGAGACTVHVIRRGFTLPGHWRLLAGEDGRRRQEKADAKRKICPSPRLSPSHTHPSGNATESLIGDRHSGRGREGGRRRRRPRLASSGEPATALLDRCRSQASVGVAREDKASSQLPSSSSGRCPVVRPAASPAPQGCGPPPKEQ